MSFKLSFIVHINHIHIHSFLSQLYFAYTHIKEFSCCVIDYYNEAKTDLVGFAAIGSIK